MSHLTGLLGTVTARRSRNRDETLRRVTFGAAVVSAASALASSGCGGSPNVGKGGDASARDTGIVEQAPDSGVMGTGDAGGDVGNAQERDASSDGRDATLDATMADATSCGADGACCAGSECGPEAPGGVVMGYGVVEFDANSNNSIVDFRTTLLVPPKPPASGTLFLWPGLQPTPGATDYQPIGNGVLQPVLTWGPSCAPGTQPAAYSTWWISAQYVNTMGSDPSHMGCYGGTIMSAAVSDGLSLTMTLAGTVWQQTVFDPNGGGEVTFDEDLMGQSQNRAEFVIEGYSSAPVSDVVFINTTITFASSDAADCALVRRGTNDFVSTLKSTNNGLGCVIDTVILRAQGIGADQ